MFYLFIKPLSFELNSPERLRVGVNSNYSRQNIHFQWNLFTIQRISKQVFFLLLQCQIKWPMKGQSNQQEHVHCVLPAETQWEVTNLWLTVQGIEDRNANASYAVFVFQITQCLANFWIGISIILWFTFSLFLTQWLISSQWENMCTCWNHGICKCYIAVTKVTRVMIITSKK